MVDRCDSPDLEMLSDRDHCCVHDAEAEIGVGFHEVSHPPQVFRVHTLDGDPVGGYLAHEGDFGFLASQFADEIAGLGEDNLGHDQLFCGGVEEGRTASMVWVVFDRRRYEWPGVDDDYRPNSSSWWSSSLRSASATLSAPGLARAMPMKP